MSITVEIGSNLAASEWPFVFFAVGVAWAVAFAIRGRTLKKPRTERREEDEDRL